MLLVHTVLTWRNERNNGQISQNEWNARMTKEGSSQDVQSSHLQSLEQGNASLQTLQEAAKAQSGLAGPTLAGGVLPGSAPWPAILGLHRDLHSRAPSLPAAAATGHVTPWRQALPPWPKAGFSPPGGRCGPTAPTRRKSALLLPPSLRSPASPALSHSARYSGPAIAFLSSAAHRLPVSPAPTTSTRSMAAAEARSVAGSRGHRVAEIVRTVPWAGRLRRRGRGSPQRWPRPRPPAPACTGARRVSPESHRPLEKDLEGTASAWASEEDCSDGRKQRPWMPQLGFFWSLVGHFWWQKGILRPGRCFGYSSSETTNYMFPDVGSSVYENVENNASFSNLWRIQILGSPGNFTSLTTSTNANSCVQMDSLCTKGYNVKWILPPLSYLQLCPKSSQRNKKKWKIGSIKTNCYIKNVEPWQ